MININTCTLFGRLAERPVIDQGNKGSCATFRIATNRRWTDKSGNPQTETAFVPCKAFNGWTDSLRTVDVGCPILVSGRLRSGTRIHEDKTYREFYVLCETVQPLPQGSDPSAPVQPAKPPSSDPVPF